MAASSPSSSSSSSSSPAASSPFAHFVNPEDRCLFLSTPATDRIPDLCRYSTLPYDSSQRPRLVPPLLRSVLPNLFPPELCDELRQYALESDAEYAYWHSLAFLIGKKLLLSESPQFITP